jgi:hypothetical protein
VVIFIPAVFFVAGIFYMFLKILSAGHSSARESLWFIVFLGVHSLVYSGLYYVISIGAARLIIRMHGKLARNVMVGSLCLGLVFMTQFPVYGGGGHGPIHWKPLNSILGEINKMYGTGTAEIVYGLTILLVCGTLLLHKLRRNEGSRDI